ncbi:MAG: pyruvate dehydrogenase complex dihydrolipoamide acetyltransferase [Saprospiraceae bacterium]|nr:pyruvate dehydrogenase complex dihydrolipoamide acetyltransferase [Candidatus Opimibacter skivensis]
MAEIIRMPRLSDTMEEGNIVGWLKKIGDKVSPGDILAEVETDKATMELESFHEGYLLYISVKEGPVPVNDILAVIGGKDEDYKAILAGDSKAAEPTNKPKETAVALTNTPENQIAVEEKVTTASESESRIKTSPLAKSIASKTGIDLHAVTGTGDGGRIVKRDVENFVAAKSSQLPTANAANASPQYGDVPLSQMRKTIARRLVESKFSAPHFYLTMKINMDKTADARKLINEQPETRISFNDFVIKACAAALRHHPAVNSSWLGDKIRINKDINIGVAVAVEEGLLVPVLFAADRMGLRDINSHVATLADKARNKKLQPQEMQGNTFTVSNLGMFGIDEFTGIINPPDAAILAVGAIGEELSMVDGKVTSSKIMKVTLSCDHRVIDGATGAKFLQTLKQYLENPVAMLV